VGLADGGERREEGENTWDRDARRGCRVRMRLEVLGGVALRNSVETVPDMDGRRCVPTPNCKTRRMSLSLAFTRDEVVFEHHVAPPSARTRSLQLNTVRATYSFSDESKFASVFHRSQAPTSEHGNERRCVQARIGSFRHHLTAAQPSPVKFVTHSLVCWSSSKVWAFRCSAEESPGGT